LDENEFIEKSKKKTEDAMAFEKETIKNVDHLDQTIKSKSAFD